MLQSPTLSKQQIVFVVVCYSDNINNDVSKITHLLGLKGSPSSPNKVSSLKQVGSGTAPRLSDSPRNSQCRCGGAGIRESIRWRKRGSWQLCVCWGYFTDQPPWFHKNFPNDSAKRGFANFESASCPESWFIDNGGFNTSESPNPKVKRHRCTSKIVFW